MPLVFIDTHARRFVTEGNPDEIYADLAEGREVRAYELIEARQRGGIRGLLRQWTRGRRDHGRSDPRSPARVLRVHAGFTVSHVASDAVDRESRRVI